MVVDGCLQRQETAKALLVVGAYFGLGFGGQRCTEFRLWPHPGLRWLRA
jgi:hypothetical protein